MKPFLPVLTAFICLASAVNADTRCSQLELNIGLDRADCGKYSAIELTVLKWKIESNDGKYVTPPRFVFKFGKSN